ncbi:uncharacterized protein LOC129611935 [Condylostylus longicornis]|uniref:uncharacterized protein LOC129611935 n=1 Tax=Condylostylus longicornis TaxID=2530218 RepID=UPI00244E4E29|nr:uncharacterized protein LOC129611935 [Condylostylus longicornis]
MGLLIYKVILLTICFVWFAKFGLSSKSVDDAHSSVTALEEIFQTEMLYLENFQIFLNYSQRILNALKSKLHEWKTNGSSNLRDNLTLNKKLQLQYRLNNISRSNYTDFAKNISQFSEDYRFPIEVDMEGVARAIGRLQDIYNFTAKEIATGEFLDFPNASNVKKLDSTDCFYIGFHLFTIKEYFQSEEWFKLAYDLYDRTKIEERKFQLKKLVHISRILSFMAHTTFRYADLPHTEISVLIMKEAVSEDPENQEVKKLLSQYEKVLNAIKYNTSRINIEKENEYYRTACRGDAIKPPELLRKLYCTYKSHGHPFLKLAPIKVEIQYIDPPLAVFHDVVYDSEIEIIKSLSTDLLSRATIWNSEESKAILSDQRTGKYGWLTETMHPVVKTINQRIEDMTDMTMKTAEVMQVMNYGIGGHYDVHPDYLGEPTDNTTKPYSLYYWGNRIATLLFYLSDVELGGATVYPHLNTAVRPIKGTAAFWFNMLPSGNFDYKSRHAACPVIFGSKWIANKWIRYRGQIFHRQCTMNEHDHYSLFAEGSIASQNIMGLLIFKVILITIFIQLGLANEPIDDAHSSVTALEEAFQTETLYFENLQIFLQHSQRILNSLRSKLHEWKINGSSNLKDNLTLNKKLQLQYRLNNISRSNYADFARNISKFSDTYRFPNEVDMEGVARAINRIQDVYNFTAKQIATGEFLNFPDMPIAKKLDSSDCFFIGYHLFRIHGYVEAEEWFNLAYDLYNKTIKEEFPLRKPVHVSRILSYVAYSTYIYGDIPHTEKAVLLIKEAIAEDPENPELYKLLIQYKTVLDSIKYNTNKIKDLFIDIMNKKACRGEVEKPSKLLRKLYCTYKSHGHPFLKLAPIKVEIQYIDPPIAVFHDVVYDSEIEIIQSLSTDLLSRATIWSIEKSRPVHSEQRTGKYSWLTETMHPVVKTINQRIEDMTDMSMKTAEALQVMNYGIGGHYDVHPDYMGDPNDNTTYSNPEWGNRIATLLFYLSDVELGGATVYPHLNTAVRPVKGTAAFWFNMLPSGSFDYKSRHAACPVIFGSKWIANKWIRYRGQIFHRQCTTNEHDYYSLFADM